MGSDSLWEREVQVRSKGSWLGGRRRQGYKTWGIDTTWHDPFAEDGDEEGRVLASDGDAANANSRHREMERDHVEMLEESEGPRVAWRARRERVRGRIRVRRT